MQCFIACLLPVILFIFRQLKYVSQLAKHNIENHYSVVGITDHLKSTFSLFKYYLPRFFDKAMQIYKEMENEDALSENVDPYRPPMTTKIKVLLMNNPLVSLDMDVYSFVLQRFHKQLESFRSNTSGTQHLHIVY